MFKKFISDLFRPKEKKLIQSIDRIAENKHLLISLRNAEKFDDLLIVLESCISDLESISKDVEYYPNTLKKFEYLLSRLKFRNNEVYRLCKIGAES